MSSASTPLGRGWTSSQVGGDSWIPVRLAGGGSAFGLDDCDALPGRSPTVVAVQAVSAGTRMAWSQSTST